MVTNNAINAKPIQVAAAVNVSLLATGNTIIFTPITPFIVTEIIAYGFDLSGTIGSPIVNFGWTAAAYSDLISGFSGFPSMQGNYAGTDISTGFSDIPPVPAATSLRINVTVADATATTNTQTIHIIGFYL